MHVHMQAHTQTRIQTDSVMFSTFMVEIYIFNNALETTGKF